MKYEPKYIFMYLILCTFTIYSAFKQQHPPHTSSFMDVVHPIECFLCPLWDFKVLNWSWMCSVHFPSLPFSSLFSVFRVLVQCVWWCAVCCHVRCAVCGVLPCAVCSVWWWGCTLGRVSYTREGELSLLHLFPHFKQLVHSSDLLCFHQQCIKPV